MATPTESSTQQNSQRNEEAKKAYEALPKVNGAIPLEDLVEFAKKYPEVKFRTPREEKAK